MIDSRTGRMTLEGRSERKDLLHSRTREKLERLLEAVRVDKARKTGMVYATTVLEELEEDIVWALTRMERDA